MAKKAIFYPDKEAEVTAYYNNIYGHLFGAIGTKYNTDAATLTELNGHKTQIPLKIQKAFDDNQTAQGSTAAKDLELENGKKNMLRELNRITSLPNWDEEDGQTLGIRVAKPPVDYTTIKGKITGVTSTPEAVIIDFFKGPLQGVIIETLAEGSPVPNPGPGPQPDPGPVWKRLGTDTRSPYEDKRVNKENGPEDRYYRIRPMKDDKPVGEYSDIRKVVAEVYPVAES